MRREAPLTADQVRTPRPLSFQAYLEVLEEFVRSAGMDAPLREIVLRMSRALVRFLGADLALHYTLERDRLTPFVWHGLGPGQVPPALPLEGDLGRRAREGQEVALLREGDLPEPLRALGLRMAVFAPIYTQQERYGVSLAGFYTPRRFTPRDLRLLNRGLTLLGQAFGLARSRRLEARLRATQEALLRVLRTAVSAGDLERMMQDLLRVMVEHFGATSGLGWVVEGNRLVPRAGYGVDPALYPTVDLDRPIGVVGLGVARRQPLVVGPEELPRLSFPVSLQRGIRQVAAVPVFVGDRVVGAFSLGWTQERPFSASDLGLLGLMAGTAGPAILNAQAVEEERRLARRHALLYRALEGAVHSPDVTRLLEGLLALAVDHWGARYGVVRLLDREAGLLRPVASAGIPLERFSPLRVDPPEGITGRAVQEGRPVQAVEEEAERLGHPSVREWGIRQVVAVPIRSREEAVGTLTLGWDRPQPLTEEELALLDLLADTVVAPLERAQALEAEQRARLQAETMAEAMGQVLGAETPREALQGLVEVLTRRYGADVGFAYLRDPSARLYRPVAGVGLPLETLGPLPEAGLYGIVGETVRRQAPVLLEGRDFRERAGTHLLTMGLVQGVGIPLLLEGQVEAVLVLACRHPRSVAPQDLQVLALAVASVGPALQRARAQEAERQRMEELTAFTRIAQVLTLPGSHSEQVHRLLEEVCRLTGADWASLRLPTPDGQGLERVSVGGPHPADIATEDRVIPVEGTLSGRAFRTGEPQVVDNYPRFPGAYESLVRRGIASLLSVPIRWGGQVVGVLNAYSTCLGFFTPERVRPVAFAADLMGALLEQSRLLEEEQKARRRLEALEAIALAGMSSLQPREAVQALLERLVALTGAKGALLHLADERAQEFRLAGVVGLPPEKVHPTMPLQGTPIARLLREGQTLVLRGEDLRDPTLSQALQEVEEEAVVVVSPLKGPRRLLGLVAVLYPDPLPHREEVVQWVEAAADRIALVMENALAYEAEQKSHRRLQALERVLEAGLSLLDPEEALRTILARLVEATRGVYGLFRRWDPERNALVAEVIHKAPAEQVRKEMPLGEGFSSRVLAEGRPLLERVEGLPETLRATFSPFFRGGWVRAMGGVPLYGRRGLLGVVVVGYPEMPEEPEEVLRLMQLAGERISLVVETALAYRALREQVVRDPLTGLLNRREFFRRLEEELARARRTGAPVSVLMLDLDRFKAVNEALGHAVGDQVLQELAEAVLRPALRPYDVIARYGGDEFVVLLSGAGREEARRVAQRLQTAVRQHTFRVLPEQGWTLGLSAGVATYPEDADTATGLVERADDALRTAKMRGVGLVLASRPEEEAPARPAGRSSLFNALADALLSALDLRVPGTARRSRAVAQCARLVAERMGLGTVLVEQTYWTGLLRDVGMLALPPGPFLRPSRTPEEEALVRQHPSLSVGLLGPHRDFQAVLPAVLAHHERWDGQGYPGRLQGKQIPLPARIVAGAELFVLTALEQGLGSAWGAVERERGGALDPSVAEALLAHREALEALLQQV